MEPVGSYSTIVVAALISIFCLGAGVFISWLFRPMHPTPIKLEPYECGEPTVGSSQVQYRPLFYLFALAFVIFDVEAIFLLSLGRGFQGHGIICICRNDGFYHDPFTGFGLCLEEGGAAMAIVDQWSGWVERFPGGGILLSSMEFFINWGRKNSLWPLTFGLSCCAIEMFSPAPRGLTGRGSGMKSSGPLRGRRI